MAEELKCEIKEVGCDGILAYKETCAVCDKAVCDHCSTTVENLVVNDKDHGPKRLCLPCCDGLDYDDYSLQKRYQNQGFIVPLIWATACCMFHRKDRQPPKDSDYQTDIFLMQSEEEEALIMGEVRDRLREDGEEEKYTRLKPHIAPSKIGGLSGTAQPSPTGAIAPLAPEESFQDILVTRKENLRRGKLAAKIPRFG